MFNQAIEILAQVREHYPEGPFRPPRRKPSRDSSSTGSGVIGGCLGSHRTAVMADAGSEASPWANA
jgi:hypothetical protein